MITINDTIIETYTAFVAGSVQSLLPLIGITAGVFLAFAIFDRIVRAVIKATRK